MVFVLILRGKDYEYNERNKAVFNKVFKFDVNINIIFYNNFSNWIKEIFLVFCYFYNNLFCFVE